MKKLLWILTICMMTLLMASVVVSAEDEYTGWTFDETTGTLTINTEYWMPNFVKTGTDSEGVPIYDTPWKNFKDSITAIVFQNPGYENNIRVGNGAFCGLTNLSEVRYEDSSGSSTYSGVFSYIGDEAFYGDCNLSHFMEEYAEGNLVNVLYVTASDDEYVGARAFSGCTALCFYASHLYPSNHMPGTCSTLEFGPEAFFGVDMGYISLGGFFNNIYDAEEAFTGMRYNSISIEFTPEEYHQTAYYYNLIDGEIWANQEMIEGPGGPDPEPTYETIPWVPAPYEVLYDPDDPCDANGHNKQYTSGTPATCTTSGTSDQCQCTVCGKTLEYSETVPALGHDWSNWVVTREPTTTLEGEETRTCSRCDVTETRPIDKLLVVVAKIGNTEYHSLQAAVQAASNGDVIVIQVDLEENITIPQGKDITIDLNGHKINNTGSFDTITNEGDFMIIDGAEGYLGVVENDQDDKVAVRNSGSMEISSGKVNATGEGSAVINTGTMVLSGGSVNAASVDNPAISNRKNAALTVSGGTVTNTASYGDAVANAGAMNMTGGTLDGVVSNTGTATLQVSGGEVTGNIAANNPDNVTLTGGTFGSDVSAYLDDDQASVKEGDSYVIKSQIFVTVQSMVEETYDQVANVSGGGRYVIGDDVIVTAASVDGFEFKGWHEKDGNAYKSDVLSYSMSYSFTADADIDLVAVYGVSAGSSDAELRVHGAGFKVNGGVTQRLYNYSQRFALNTHIVLTATDDNFLYWMNSSNKILTTNSEYSFDIKWDTEVTAVYKNADTNTAFVEFVSDYGQVMQAQNYGVDSDITMPTGPSKSGFSFKKWDLTADEIRSRISGDEAYITVHPEYEALSGTSSLKVIHDGTVTDEQQLVSYKQYRINAIDISGKTFSHWEDENGQWLSTSESYKYYLDHDSTIHGVYVNSSETVTQKPVIALTNIAAKVDGNSNKLEFVVVRDVPEGYTVLSNGVVYSANSKFGAEGGSDLLVVNASNAATQYSTNNDRNGVYIYTVNVGSSVNTVVYMKGFMRVRNDATGEEQIIYTYMGSKSFNQAN